MKESSDKVVATAQAVIRVSELPTGSLKILCVGDSLTRGGIWPMKVAQHMDAAGVNRTFLGTVKTENNVKFEGYGGNTWARYYDGSLLPSHSPFWYQDSGYDLGRYINHKLQGEQPDLVIFFLGTNDNFSASRKNEQDQITRLREMFEDMQLVLEGFLHEMPDAHLAFILLPPGNLSQAAFDTDYGLGQFQRNRSRDFSVIGLGGE